MRLLRHLSAVAPMPAPRATTLSDYNQAFFAGDPIPDLWLSSLAASGIQVTPELAMMIAAFYSGVTMIAYDLATVPCATFKVRSDGGKDKVLFSMNSAGTGGIGDIAYKLRWAPNNWMTSAEFWACVVASLKMRSIAYAEIVDGPNGFLDQLLPRHPDRIQTQRLPNGKLRYKLSSPSGAPRYLTQDEMFVVREMSIDGVHPLSRVSYGAQTIGTILAAEKAAATFFKSGMMAQIAATYSGELDEEYEESLHKSISRFAGSGDNNAGILIAPDVVKVSNLSIEPDKAQMMEAREYGVREIARMLRLPPNKLGVEGTTTYASQVQVAVDYVIGCLRPDAVLIEQCIQRDLILAKTTYFAEFELDALLRGDPAARATYYQAAIKNRWMRPNEVRLRENMNPDPALDKLSETDYRPGGPVAPGQQPGNQSGGDPNPATTDPDDAGDAGDGENDPVDGGQNGGQNKKGRKQPPANGRFMYAGFLAIHDNAVRCCRRERIAIEKIARKHADDPRGWAGELREFYADHARFVAETMRLPIRVARVYAAQHGSVFESQGMAVLTGESGATWEREEADELALLVVSADGMAA